MVIEFNPSQIPPMESSQPTAKREAAPAASDAVSFSNTESLKSQLSTLSTVRPDKVAAAKDLVADGNYPSDDDLSRIAGLLASHIGTDTTSEAS